MTLHRLSVLALLSLLVTVPAIASAAAASVDAERVGWRMDGDGRYPDARPPLTWSPTENVVWKRSLPSWSNASPVLLDEQALIIVLSEPDEIVAVSAEDGEIAWRDSLADVSSARSKAHDANGWTSPTPVSDGRHVYTVLGSGVVAAHSVDGERRWARLVEKPEHRWGSSASPVLAGGRLIVQRLELIALDPATGEEAWRAASEPKWGSPVAARIGETEVVITPAGDVFRAEDGERVASAIGQLEYATPVVQDGVVYFIEKRATAVRLPESLDQPFDTLWEARIQGSRHYASSLIHDGLIYAVSREQLFTVLDAATGEVVHERRLELDSANGSNSAYPSIALGGQHVFLSVVNGTTIVLEPGAEAKQVARSAIEGFRSSPVFDGDRMYIRAFEHLYCFGSEAQGAERSGR